MRTISLQEAQAHLIDLVRRLAPGEEVLITENDLPVARLESVREPHRVERRLGTLRGSVLHLATDFDAPLEDFAKYSG